MHDVLDLPRLILAGLGGGAGKTILSLGLSRAWTRSGHLVAPFKKGPDYIDATWLGLAARAPATNLDPFLMDADLLPALLAERAHDCDVAVIEGNRGLFDGKDVTGSCSTAQLARLLKTPVVVIIDCTKMTRTVAAIVKGVSEFEEGVHIAGVVLNRTAGERHREILRESIEHHTDVAVLGALPKLDPDPIPERHMGLISNREYGGQEEVLERLADIVKDNLDLEKISRIAALAPPLETMRRDLWPGPVDLGKAGPVSIGYVRDASLWFYYEENLDSLRKAGANLVELSLLARDEWPDIHGLYLGGGFPETMAKELAANTAVRQRVRAMAEMGMPIYAECGGFMFLGQSLEYEDRTYPMAGVFPVRTKLFPKPQGLGYVEAEVVAANPFFRQGAIIRGHEFHYSRCLAADGSVLELGLKMIRGNGMLAGYDGLRHKMTLASYTHIHGLGVREWAGNFVRAAATFRGDPGMDGPR